jgi:hypothetical protein
MFDPAEEFEREGERGTNWRDEYKSLEVSWHQLKDQYSELARALGFDGDSFWGDPLVSHNDVLARARECKGAHDYFHRKPAMDIW